MEKYQSTRMIDNFPLPYMHPLHFISDTHHHILTASSMARIRKARTGLIILLLLCGTAGYLAHGLVKKHTLAQTPSTTHILESESKPKIPIRKLGSYVEWSWPPRTAQLQAQAVRLQAEEDRLVFGKDGLVRNWEDGGEGKAMRYTKISSRVRYGHPIYQLIQRGQEKWKRLLERYDFSPRSYILLIVRQSKTLSQAVAEYKRRYGRPPPKGFERWWSFARQNNIKIVDDVR
jgi:hypothetical protein